jgi:hypothetical protein
MTARSDIWPDQMRQTFKSALGTYETPNWLALLKRRIRGISDK